MIDFYMRWPWFSWTEWLWNIEKVRQEIIIPDNFRWVRNYSELKDKINSIYIWNSERQIFRFTKGLFDLLDKIHLKTWEDPILYLYSLYYWEKNKMSVDQIANRLIEMWIDTNSSTLDRNLRTRFWWDLVRDDRQLATLRNNDAENHKFYLYSQINELNAKDIEERSEKLIDEVIEVSKWRVIAIMSSEVKDIYLKADKIAFILHKYWLIKDNTKEELKVFLLRFRNDWIWVRKIAKILNNLINHFDQNLDIKLVPTNIIHWTEDKYIQ